MITVGELFHSVQKTVVLDTLSRLYTGEGEDPEGYDQMFDTILVMQPKNLQRNMKCVLRRCKDGWFDVSGMVENDETSYALEFVGWSEWLSFPIVVDESCSQLSNAEILSHIMYEMTWGGYTLEAQEKNFHEIQDMADTVKEILEECEHSRKGRLQ